ncbi:MAG: response regulator [Moraxellaceae bacterium]|nr:response regulator [Moraxellaceae bacterium]
MMGQKFFNPRSAYGQLILLIFLPIFFLSMVGGLMVYLETMHANRHEQQVLAKAILIRYQPIIKAQLPIILEQPNEESDNSNHLTNNQLQNLLFSVQTESELQRIAIINDEGEVLQSAGFKTLHSWRNIKPKAMKTEQQANGKNKFIFNVKTDVGTAYGISFGELNINGKKQALWLFVDMDNQPLKIAQYRIALALAITGLLTLLLLLLSLNIYSRRWIEPLYQLRLYLQGVTIDNLTKPLEMYGHGELSHLKEDLVTSLKRVDDSFQELKAHTEQTENDLRQAFDEMEMQNISIRTARDRAVSTSEAKSAFLANISHELRTPLNSIDGFINLLARHGKLSAEQDLYVQTIRKSSAHLLALVNDVLDFSKIEAGKLVLDNHEFDLYDAIYDVVDMLSPVASEKGLRLAVLFYNDVPLSIMGDALRVKQVLTNLVANAIKFTDTGSILVKVSLDDNEENQLLISVQDTGRGVSEENQRLLFRNFTQGDPSITRQYGGTGLGLVISKQLTHLMGGKIGHKDNVKENIASTGSTFYFSLPAHVDVLEVENASDISLPMLSETPQDSEKRLQILLWINHADSVRVLKASLQPLPIDITETHSLVSTLDILKEEGNKWDWVIVDSDTNSTSTETDNMTALLKQLRLHYQGKLAVYGYQIALDNALLARYKVAPLHEPIDKRQLYRMLDKRKQSDNKEKANIQKWKGYRVLAVDDHMPNLLVLDALLMEQGIEVVTANSGFDAIEIISKQSAETAENKIDLIFMDIQMPRMSGHQASEQIRNIDKNEPPIPIIALTAHGMLDERDKLIKSGIDDYVSKPISQPQLLQILQKWLGKKSLEVEENISEETPTENADNSINAEELLVIDWEDALSRSANKPDLSARLIMMMIDSIAEEKQALINAWQAEDSEKLAQISHRILGASRYTGVPQLRYASETLEKECLAYKEQNQQDINLLTSHYNNLLQALDNLANIDLSPWPQLRYHKFDEDDMTWKMI